MTHPIMKGILNFLKSETVLVIAALAAAISACIVQPSMEYLDYLDFRVLALLFCLMAVVAGLGRVGVFQVVSQSLLRRAANIRILALVLVLLCFFSAMLITNDVALITFVPLAMMVLALTDPRTIAYVVTLQTVAANLGSMLTPVGNPQNLYLFAYYHMTVRSFLELTLPLTGFSLLLLIAATFFVKVRAIELRFPYRARIGSRKQLAMFIGLFLALPSHRAGPDALSGDDGCRGAVSPVDQPAIVPADRLRIVAYVHQFFYFCREYEQDRSGSQSGGRDNCRQRAGRSDSLESGYQQCAGRRHVIGLYPSFPGFGNRHQLRRAGHTGGFPGQPDFF